MDRFVMSRRYGILGTLSSFDRVIFKGHQPISHARARRGHASGPSHGAPTNTGAGADTVPGTLQLGQDRIHLP